MNFKVDGATSNDVVAFSSGYYYLDDATTYKAHVGATKSGASTYLEPFAGFMYAIYIDNTLVDGSSASSWYPTQSGGCTPLAHSTNDCLGNFNFDEYANGS